MYPPQAHRETDREALFAAIEAIVQATVLLPAADGLLTTYAPLLLDRARGAQGTLRGHMAAVNPQAALLDGATVHVIFHGPHAYISPRLYGMRQVPTWNYLNVNVRGIARVLRGRAAVHALVRQLAEYMDGAETADAFPIEDDKVARLLDHIVGFEIDITQLEGRFKISRNKSAADLYTARRALLEQSAAQYRELIERVVTPR